MTRRGIFIIAGLLVLLGIGIATNIVHLECSVAGDLDSYTGGPCDPANPH